ncbi:hypothetical protein EVA_11330 [gut metagenome]|uniref:Uncharacterized protein n=1 Tax=gut metagenome TaxID=749906 RepID=J9GFL9_9ZZZZ
MVGITIALCLGRILYEIYLFFYRTEKKENPCESCVSSCELKTMIIQKQNKSGENKQRKKGNDEIMKKKTL